jgi:hypothetical protein
MFLQRERMKRERENKILKKEMKNEILFGMVLLFIMIER